MQHRRLAAAYCSKMRVGAKARQYHRLGWDLRALDKGSRYLTICTQGGTRPSCYSVWYQLYWLCAFLVFSTVSFTSSSGDRLSPWLLMTASESCEVEAERSRGVAGVSLGDDQVMIRVEWAAAEAYLMRSGWMGRTKMPESGESRVASAGVSLRFPPGCSSNSVHRASPSRSIYSSSCRGECTRLHVSVSQ